MRKIAALFVLAGLSVSAGCRSADVVTGRCDCGEYPGEAHPIVSHSPLKAGAPAVQYAPPVHAAPIQGTPVPAPMPAYAPAPAGIPTALPTGPTGF